MAALLVVLTIIVGLTLDFIVRQYELRKERELLSGLKPGAGSLALEKLEHPLGVFLSPTHLRVALDPAGPVRIGLDGFLNKVFGHVDEIQLPEPGKMVSVGSPLIRLRQGSRTIEIPSPVEGMVIRRVSENPNTDVMRQGWLLSLEPKDPARDLKGMKLGRQAREWLNSELERLADYLCSQPMMAGAAADGGQIVGGVIGLVDDATFYKFAHLFVPGSSALLDS